MKVDVVCPTGRHLGTARAETKRWHKLRADGVGGSEVAAVLGLSPWESAFSLFWRKRGLAAPDAPNDEMRWGTILEPVLAKQFERTSGSRLTRNVGTWQHVDRTWARCNPDGLIAPDGAATGLWEGKTARNGDEWGDDGTDEIPVYYRCQVMHSLDVLGLDEAWLSVLIAGSDFRTYYIPYDETDATLIRDAVDSFWVDVCTGKQPPIDAHVATTDTLRRLHPSVEDREVDIDPALAERWAQACAAEDDAKAVKAQVANELLDVIGDGRAAVCDGRKVVTRVVYDETRIDADRLRAEQPELAATYSKTTTKHVLRRPPKPRASKTIGNGEAA